MILYIMATPLTVDLFGSLNYEPLRAKVGVGKYPTVAEMKAPGRDITSLKVPAGLTATLYSDQNYTGQSLVLVGPISIPDLRATMRPPHGDWNDILASMVVTATAPGTAPGTATAPGTSGTASDYMTQAKDWFMANMWLAIGLILLVVVAIYFAFFNNSPEYTSV